MLGIQAEPFLFQSLLFHLPVVYSCEVSGSVFLAELSFFLPQRFCSPAEQTHFPQLFLTAPAHAPAPSYLGGPMLNSVQYINVFAV